MKKVSVLLAIIMAMMVMPSLAESPTRFSPSMYTEEELTSIRDIIMSIQSKEPGSVVIDKEGLVIEWNGLTRQDYRMGVADIIITNVTGNNIILKLTDQKINGFKMDTWNNDFSIESGELVMLKNKHNFMFSAEKLIDEFGIRHITSYQMNLSVLTKDDDKTPLFDVSFSVALDLPLEELFYY